jgi:hypothetical protein
MSIILVTKIASLGLVYLESSDSDLDSELEIIPKSLPIFIAITPSLGVGNY